MEWDEYKRADLEQFKEHVWSFYTNNSRSFPWRHELDPYKVLVSEIMLQQTQTYRVIEKYNDFIYHFPTVNTLALASFSDVLSAWNGLGYNRRALFLHKTAQTLVEKHDSIIPNDEEILFELPGIGKATAASICAFAFNKPTIFIETNVRAVFLHHFFPLQESIDDSQLFPLVEKTVDRQKPREWYYALMDYGVHLKKIMPNPSRKSKHHAKQSSFEGSNRQIRGTILRILLEFKTVSLQELVAKLGSSETQRIDHILLGLAKDQLIIWHNSNDLISIR